MPADTSSHHRTDANIYRNPSVFGYPTVRINSISDPKFGARLGCERMALPHIRSVTLTCSRHRLHLCGDPSGERKAPEAARAPQPTAAPCSAAVLRLLRAVPRRDLHLTESCPSLHQDGLDWIPSSAANAKHKQLQDGLTELVRHYCTCAACPPLHA